MLNRRIFQLLSIISALLIVVSTCSAVGYKGIYIGEDIADLPKELHCSVVFCEGPYKGDWIRVGETQNKVTNFDVIYSGKSLGHDTVISRSVTLATALRTHSLQPGFAAPVLGLAKGLDHQPYGLIDIANAIVYHVNGTPIDPAGSVVSVGYVGPTAPVLKTSALPESQSLTLLTAARQAKTDSAESLIASADDLVKFASADEAREELDKQADVVIGKGRKTLALVKDVTTWYEVDEKHPEALEKGEQLKHFMRQFPTYGLTNEAVFWTSIPAELCSGW
jgi:hypothetical protein